VGVAYNLRHLSYHKKYAWAPLQVGENRMKKFQSVPEIPGVQKYFTPAVYVTKIGLLLEG